MTTLILYSRETNSPAISEDGCSWKKKNVYSTSVTKSTDILFLIDTGANVRAIPHKSGQQLIPTSYKLQTANESKIDTYGEKPLT